EWLASPAPAGRLPVCEPAFDRAALDLRAGRREPLRQLAHPGGQRPVFLTEPAAGTAVLQVGRDGARLAGGQGPFKVGRQNLFPPPAFHGPSPSLASRRCHSTRIRRARASSFFTRIGFQRTARAISATLHPSHSLSSRRTRRRGGRLPSASISRR